MATSPKELKILKENQNSKPKRNNLTHFEESAVASEDDLDGILRDVEKIEANVRSCNKDKPKWKPGIEFTPEDEKDLDQIFEDAERRKKEIEELLDAAKSDNSDDDDDTSSISSSTSDDSNDSDLDRLLDDVETHDAPKLVTKAVSQHKKATDNEMDKILKDVKRTESEAGFKK